MDPENPRRLYNNLPILSVGTCRCGSRHPPAAPLQPGAGAGPTPPRSRTERDQSAVNDKPTTENNNNIGPTYEERPDQICLR